MSRTDDLWIEHHVGLRDHPKTARLRRRLGVSLPTAVGLVSLVWGWAVRYAPDGDLSRFDADVIADAAGWDDDAGVFVRALVSAGFLNEDLHIHDWQAYAGRLIDRRAKNAARMKEARDAAKNGTAFEHGRPDDDSTSGDRAMHVQGLPDRTGPDITGPEKTTTPQPPPHAEGERAPNADAVRDWVPERNQRGRRRSGGESSTPSAPLEVPELQPPTDADRELWDAAKAAASADILPANAEKVAALEPLGRDGRGALWLRGPPKYGDLAMFANVVRRALDDAGDAAAALAVVL